jgi:hypothetical protein
MPNVLDGACAGRKLVVRNHHHMHDSCRQCLSLHAVVACLWHPAILTPEPSLNVISSRGPSSSRGAYMLS